MVDNKEKRKEYMRQWRLDNPEKWKAINERNLKLWREKNPDKYKEQYTNYNQRKRDQKKSLDKS